MPRRNIDVHRKYSLVVRIDPDHVSFETLAAMRINYNSRQQFPKVLAKSYFTPQLSLANSVWFDFYRPVSSGFDEKWLHNFFTVQDVQ